MNGLKLALILISAAALPAQETTNVVSKNLERKLKLPAELLPYQSVVLHARVQGFVEKVDVDRGSMVTKGQLLVQLSAPEMAAQLAEAEAKAVAIESNRAEAEAKLAAAQSTYDKLKEASATPGVIAGNEVVQASKAVDAAKGAIAALTSAAKAARAAQGVIKDMQAYLQVTAPFDGIVTERMVHPGALAGPGGNMPLLRIEQVSTLRLVVPVPESEVSGIIRGAVVPFTAADKSAVGTIVRIPRVIDAKTRTMPVELDVKNGNGALAPGMFAEVTWPVRKPRMSLLVPPTSVVTTTEKVFVIRVKDGKAEWVPVKKGAASGDLVEVFGDLSSNDKIVKRGSDELREGTAIK
jgi:membrane fusion protein (multidrug efflux system)